MGLEIRPSQRCGWAHNWMFLCFCVGSRDGEERISWIASREEGNGRKEDRKGNVDVRNLVYCIIV